MLCIYYTIKIVKCPLPFRQTVTAFLILTLAFKKNLIKNTFTKAQILKLLCKKCQKALDKIYYIVYNIYRYPCPYFMTD